MPEEFRRQGTPEPLAEEESNRLLALTSFDRRRVAQKVFEWLSQPPFTNQSNHEEQVRALAADIAGAGDDAARIDAEYRWAIARAPDDRWLHFNYGVYLKDHDPVAAVAAFQRAVDLLPDNHEAREMLADALIAAARFDEAVVQCDELLRRMPYHAPAYLTKAYALAQERAYDASIAAYERAIELHPSYAVAAYNQIGVIRLHQGRFDSAAASFRKAIELDETRSRTPELRANLDVALAKLGEHGGSTPPTNDAARSKPGR
jgi:tetratricopeptide (TPR) repeat protein